MPLLILITLFVGMPILEISLLLKVSGVIGGFKTIIFVIFTAVLGAYLVKQQGIATFAKFQQEAGSGQLPAQSMLEGVALLFAGAVLLTPGFFTDAIGFSLLIPAVRRALISYFINRGVVMTQSTNFTSGFESRSSSHGSVIEGEYSDAERREK